MTSTLANQTQRDNNIQNNLNKFNALAIKYVFGKVNSSCIESGLTLKRPSLLTALQQDQKIEFGPITNHKAVL